MTREGNPLKYCGNNETEVSLTFLHDNMNIVDLNNFEDWQLRPGFLSI